MQNSCAERSCEAVFLFARVRIQRRIPKIENSYEFSFLGTNLASTPLMNAGDSCAPYFFASSTASLMETEPGIVSSNKISYGKTHNGKLYLSKAADIPAN